MRLNHLYLIVALISQSGNAATASHVEIKHDNGRFQLFVDGAPYIVKGAGGLEHLDLLKAAGGNTIRTWSVDENTTALLDKAHHNGLKVVLGIWMGHPRLGFNYSDPGQVRTQFEKARSAVLKHKDHPALLMWSVGNEVELKTQPDKREKLWEAINDVGLMIKALDPHHPTMTITSDLGEGVVEAIRDRCTSIDIHGINSYGGAASLPGRYRKARGTKPYMLTEFGPTGIWEMGTNGIGAYVEPTSTAKAIIYRDIATKLKSDTLNVGSFAFLWGQKQEVTSTWFGMLLADGSRLAAVDAMTEVWTGLPPANRVPVTDSLKTDTQRVPPGEIIEVKTNLSDPEGDSLSVEWSLVAEGKELKSGGDPEDAPDSFPAAVIESTDQRAVLQMPKKPGLYRVFLHVRDGHGGAATANLPVLVDKPKSARD